MAFELRCNVCGKPARVVAASAYGATSYAFCDECLEKGLEPYSAVVAYIACAGHFPEDIMPPKKPGRLVIFFAIAFPPLFTRGCSLLLYIS